MTTYFSRKYSKNYTIQVPFPEITESTYGLMVYSEQAEELAVKATGMSYKQAKRLSSKLRMCLMEAWNYETSFKSSGRKQGLSDTELNLIWTEFAVNAKYHITQKYTMAVSWLCYQLEYLKVYYADQFSDLIEKFNHEKSIYFDGYLQRIREYNNLNISYTI